MAEPQTAAPAGEPAAVGGGGDTDVLEDTVADRDQLEAFSSLPAAQRRPLHAALRGVLAETALTGLQRYEWRLLVPLLHSLVDSVLADYAEQEAEGEGPPRPPPPGYESAEALAAQLHALLDGHEDAPFTLQRLCEVLLEPRKQYSRRDKVALAIEKLLTVTSTRQPDTQLPPPPALATLSGVNNNPHSPYLDGRPPQVLDTQQQAALLQQQAMASAQQQQLQQQHHGRQFMGGLANGLGDDGPPPLEGMNGEPEPSEAEAAAAAEEAAATSEAMQLEAAAFVEAALADSGHGSGEAAAGGSTHEGQGGSSSPTRAAAASDESGNGPGETAGGGVPATPPEEQPTSPAAAMEGQEQQAEPTSDGAGEGPVPEQAAGPSATDSDVVMEDAGVGEPAQEESGQQQAIEQPPPVAGGGGVPVAAPAESSAAEAAAGSVGASDAPTEAALPTDQPQLH